MNLNIEIEQEDDGRWLAKVSEISGALAYRETPVPKQARVLLPPYRALLLAFLRR